MKHLLKLLGVMSAMIISLFPMTIFSVYLFTGFEKQATIDLLNKIPVESFWMFMLPNVVILYCTSCWLFYKMFETAFGKMTNK